jgi:hypothetical protein
MLPHSAAPTASPPPTARVKVVETSIAVATTVYLVGSIAGQVNQAADLAHRNSKSECQLGALCICAAVDRAGTRLLAPVIYLVSAASRGLDACRTAWTLHKRGSPRWRRWGVPCALDAKQKENLGRSSDVDSANGFSTARSRANSRTGNTGAVEPSTTFT